MPWYAYKRGGWEIGVDAMNQHDASKYIQQHAQGAKFMGAFTPGFAWNSMTAMTTYDRQRQIHEYAVKEMEEYNNAK